MIMNKLLNIKVITFSLLTIFLPILPLLLLVGLFILSDTILGVWAAKKRGEEITSRKLSAIISKMVLYQSAVIIGFLLDKHLLGEFIKIFISHELFFTKMITMTLIFIEGVSLSENFESITGKNIMKYFRNMLKRATNIKDDVKTE